MRLLKRMLVLAASFGSVSSLSVLFSGSEALAFDGQGTLLAQTAFIAVGVGATAGALALYLSVKRARSRAFHHAELVQLARVPEDNPHPIL